MRDPRLVVRGCGVTTFWGIKDATVDYISIDLRDNCIKSFVHFGTHPKLVELRLGNNKIDCFMGLTRQPSLTVIDLEGNPIASHPLCRIMVLLVVGFSVTEINGIPVSDEEYRRARYFGYSAALAVSHGWNLQPEVRTPNEYRLIVEECRKSWRGAHAPEGATITLAHVLKRGEQTEWTKLSLENKARGAGIVPLNSEDIDQMLLHARKLEELLSDVKRRQADKLWCLREGIETEAVGGMTASELCCAESLLFTNGIRWRTNVNSDCDSDGFCRGALLFEGLLLVFLTFMSRARVAEFALSDIRVEYHSNFLRICGKGGAMFDVMFGSSQVLVSVYKLIYLRQGLTAPLLALNDNIEGTIKLLTNVADKGARMSQGQPVVDANMQASYQGRGNMGPPPNPAGMPLGLTFTGEGDLDASKTVDKTAHELKCTANGIHNNCIPSAVMGGFAESQQSIVMDDTCQNSSTWTQVTLPVDCTVDDTTLLCHSVQSHRNEKKNAPSFCMPCYHTNADRSPPTAPTMMLSGDEDAVSARSANPSTVRKRSARSSSVSKRDHQEAPGTALATSKLSGGEDAVSTRSTNPSTVRKRSARSSSVSKRDHQEAPGRHWHVQAVGGEDAVSTRSANPSTMRKRSARSSLVSKRDQQEAPGTALGTSKLSGGEDAVSTRSANPSTMRKRSARSSLVSKRDQQEAPGTALGTSKLSGGEDAVSTRSANPSTMRKRSARSSLVSKRDQQEAPGTALGTSKLSGGEDAVSTRSANPSTMRKRSARSSSVSKRDQQEAPGTALARPSCRAMRMRSQPAVRIPPLCGSAAHARRQSASATSRKLLGRHLPRPSCRAMRMRFQPAVRIPPLCGSAAHARRQSASATSRKLLGRHLARPSCRAVRTRSQPAVRIPPLCGSAAHACHRRTDLAAVLMMGSLLPHRF
ncbi:hypothetical protein ERJ75_000052800 [Trypanosoma vivax]|nr:hypothetical protein ERJ75_000052800 [Trypanosoma vivax]